MSVIVNPKVLSSKALLYLTLESEIAQRVSLKEKEFELKFSCVVCLAFRYLTGF